MCEKARENLTEHANSTQKSSSQYLNLGLLAVRQERTIQS